MLRSLLTLSVVLFALGTAHAAEFTVEKSEGGAVVKVDGQLFTEYLTFSGAKPILWPLYGPTGKAMTRAYPMVEGVDGERKDHHHHRSFWFTHGEVNGIDFWSESGKNGKILHRKFVKLEGGERAVIVTENDWVDPSGKKVCDDVRTLTFGANKDQRWIDFDCVVNASAGDVTFGNTKEGAFGVRVAGTMKVDSKLGGKILTSEGLTDKEAWGKPAAWVDYHGPVEGETLGVAILNHPSSFRYPNAWHVRTYGLFTANPFGLKDFDSANPSGEHTIPSGGTMRLSYRVLLHKGDTEEGRVAEAFAEYSKIKKGE